MNDEPIAPKIVLIESYLRLHGFRDVTSQKDNEAVLFSMTLDREPYQLKVSTPWLEALPLKNIESRLNALHIVLCLFQHHSATIGPLPA